MAALVTVKSGDWHDPTVWNGGAVPTTSDTFKIENGHTVTISQSIAGAGILNAESQVRQGGVLKVSPTANITIAFFGNLRLLGDARFEIGTLAQPITGSVALTASTSINSNSALWPTNSSTFSVVGNVQRRRQTAVVANAASGDVSITVLNASNWQVGDRILIASPLGNFGIDTTVSSVAGNVIGVPALAGPVLAGAPVLNLTSNVTLAVGSTSTYARLINNSYTTATVTIQDAVIHASNGDIPNWDLAMVLWRPAVLTRTAVVCEKLTNVGGVDFYGDATDLAVVSGRTNGRGLRLNRDANINGLAVVGSQGGAVPILRIGTDFANNIPALGVKVANANIVGVGGSDYSNVCEIAAVPIDVSNMRVWSWRPTKVMCAVVRPFGGQMVNFSTLAPGAATPLELRVYEGRLDTKLIDSQVKLIAGPLSEFGNSFLTYTTGALGVRGEIDTPAVGPGGLTGILRVIGASSTVPLNVNPAQATLGGKIGLWFYRDAGATQTISIAGGSGGAVTVPGAVQTWHRVLVDVALGSDLVITSTGTQPYWVHGAKLQQVGAVGRFWGYTVSGTVQVADARVTMTELAALTLPVTVNHTTQTVTVNGVVTANELWHALVADLCSMPNLNLPSHVTMSTDGSVTTSYTVAFGAGGGIDGSVIAANGKTTTLRLFGLAAVNVLILDGAGAVHSYTQGISGEHKVLLHFASTGTWTWVVKRPGYEHASGTFDPSLGGIIDVLPSTPQKLTPDGAAMFAGTPSPLITVEIVPGVQASVEIGDGMAPLQGTFDATEIALASASGMHWIANGGDDCSIFNSAGGDYLFLSAGWRLMRDAASATNAGINAFVISTEGQPVDEILGPVRFLTSDSSTAIAAAVRQALLADLAALPAQVWGASNLGPKVAGTVGAALQDAAARVSASL